MEQITSAHNTKLKLVASLKQKKYRDQSGLFVVEGIRLCEEALASNWEVEFALCSEAADNQRLAKLLAQIVKAGHQLCCANESLYAKAADTQASQGILMVLKQSSTKLSQINDSKVLPFIVIIDGVQDPGNVGTILRTANAAGCSGAILMHGSADVFAPKTVRATMGALFQLPVVTGVTISALNQFLTDHELPVLGTALDKTAKSCFAIDYSRPLAVAFGNEGNGLSADVLAHCTERIFIPMKNNAESLNVATAAAVVIYEGFRQRLL